MDTTSSSFFDYSLQNNVETLIQTGINVDSLGSVGSMASAPPTPGIKSIIGETDDRQILSDMLVRNYPWRAICHLEIVANDGVRYQGTGFLINSRLLLTAAHNLFNPSELGGYASAVIVRPGLSGESVVLPATYGIRILVTEKWKLHRHPDDDIGGLVLPTPIGDTLGYFAYKGKATVSPGVKITVAGYPSGGNNRIYWQTDSVAALGSTSLWYRVDTTTGQSGSPAWIEHPGNTPRLVLAVHTNDEQLAPPTVGEANRGIRITPQITSLIDSWVRSSQPA